VGVTDFWGMAAKNDGIFADFYVPGACGRGVDLRRRSN